MPRAQTDNLSFSCPISYPGLANRARFRFSFWVPPNFRDFYGSLNILYRRWLPRSFHWGWLTISLGLVTIPARAQTLERPSPPDKSTSVRAHPVLTWSYGITNLLS